MIYYVMYLTQMNYIKVNLTKKILMCVIETVRFKIHVPT